MNSLLAEKFMKMKSTTKRGDDEGGDIVDDRFASLFKRAEFEQDQESHEFKLRNPSGGPGGRGDEAEDSEDDDLRGHDGFTAVSHGGRDEDEDEYSDDDGAGYSSGNDSIMGDVVYDKSERDAKKAKNLKSAKKKETQKAKQMYEISAGVNSDKVVFGHSSEQQKKRKIEKLKQAQVLGSRVSAEMNSGVDTHNRASNKVKIIKSSEGIVREMSYVPKSKDIGEFDYDFADDGKKKSKKSSGKRH